MVEARKDPDYGQAVRDMNYFEQKQYNECRNGIERFIFASEFKDEAAKYSFWEPETVTTEEYIVNKLKNQFNSTDVFIIDERAIIGELNGYPTAIVNTIGLEEVLQVFPSFVVTKPNEEQQYDVISLREFDCQDLGDKLVNIAYLKAEDANEEAFKEAYKEYLKIYQQPYYAQKPLKKKTL